MNERKIVLEFDTRLGILEKCIMAKTSPEVYDIVYNVSDKNITITFQLEETIVKNLPIFSSEAFKNDCR